MAIKTVDVAVLYAVGLEGREIIDALSANKSPVTQGVAPPGPRITLGRVLKLRVAAVETGMGKTNAAAATAAVIERYRPGLIINMGIAGAYISSGLKRGDVAAALKEVYADEGVAGSQTASGDSSGPDGFSGLDGFCGLEKIGIPIYKSGRKKYFNEFPLDEKLVARAAKILGRNSISLATGAFATVSAVSGSPARAIEIQRRTGAICENMEGAAVVHVCTMYRTPVMEIRGISNDAGLRDKSGWDIDAAVKNSARAVIILLQNMSLLL
jgi:futalosine hydrolase